MTRIIALILLFGWGCDSSAPAEPSGPHTLTVDVLSLNLRNKEDWWEDRMPLVADGVVALAPDVIGFQEVATQEMQLEVLLGLVDEGDPELDYRFEVTLKAEPHATLTGEALATAARFPIVDKDVVYLSEARVASFSRLDLGRGHRLDVYNTHLHPAASDADVRLAQVNSILEFIDSHNDGWPVVLTGDFNATSDEDALGAIRAAGYTDTYAKVHGAETETKGATSPVSLARKPVEQKFTRRIDYIFLRSGTRETSSKVIDSTIEFNEPAADGLYPTDHLGVFTTIDLAFPE
ncbi:MAG: endonuclease/exonuclease/phosphatase family protein [Myxococcales bacterium]|nr:endonuclease/exonuclease/phosphatase family protein [Myxococcales bacterium]